MNIYPVIVIYNRKCSDSFSCINLIESGYMPTIVDNSTADYGNEAFCLERGMRYISMQGNAGLPKAYNAALKILKEIDDGNGLVIWMDDDTEIGEEYLRELKGSIAEHTEADIFVPKVYSIDKPGTIISPLLSGEKKDTVLRAINSGMCVRLKVYDEYAYDENLFLDCVDHDFMCSMNQKGIKTYVLSNACLYQHLFFHNKWATKESARKRREIYNKDYKYFKRKTGTKSHTIVNEWYYMRLFPIYDKLTTPKFKKLYRTIKHKFINSDYTDSMDNEYDNYIILTDDCGIISGYMLADIETAKRIYLTRTKSVRNLPLFILKRIKSLQAKITLKCLAKIKGRVLLTNEVLQYISTDLLNTMKQNGCRLTLLMIDPMSAELKSVTMAKEALKDSCFYKVYTFDSSDAEKCGFEYINTLYSAPGPVIADSDIRYDLLYCANIKDRKETLEKLRLTADDSGASINFMVPGFEGYALDWYIPYEEMIEELQHANCILDITQKGQSGVTLRYYEAVVYNRKLLTNNKHIVELPFYDGKYMKIYDDINDIDWDWVKNRKPINYRYHGEFSPNYAGFFD